MAGWFFDVVASQELHLKSISYFGTFVSHMLSATEAAGNRQFIPMVKEQALCLV